jgi:hypothetical protein
MRSQRLAVALAAVNLAILVVLLLRGGSAAAQDIAPVVRAGRFELVDESGRVRASIRAESEPDATVLRLMDESGTIRVKLGADTKGSRLVLLDDRTELGVQIGAQGAGSFVRVVDRDGREQVVKP